MALQGIDISSYQSGLNLDNISYDFVAIKATQGVNYINPYCDTHFQEAAAKGKKLAVYHYADGNDAAAEADYFVNACAGYIGKAIFVLDWEGTGTEYTQWALAFLQRVESRIGYKPAIYMSESVENANDWSQVVAGDYGLWLAKYSDYEIDNNYDMSGAGKTPESKYWPFYFMWQWTSKGHLNGYAGDLDCNIAYLTPEQWDTYAGYKPAPAPEAAPVEVPVATPVEAPVEVPVVPEIEHTQIPAPTEITPVDATVTPAEPPVAPPVAPEVTPEAVIIKDTTDTDSAFQKFLKGKKTYIVAALIAIVNYLIAQHILNIDGPTMELINGLLAAAGLASLRAAVAHVNNKL